MAPLMIELLFLNFIPGLILLLSLWLLRPIILKFITIHDWTLQMILVMIFLYLPMVIIIFYYTDDISQLIGLTKLNNFNLTSILVAPIYGYGSAKILRLYIEHYGAKHMSSLDNISLFKIPTWRVQKKHITIFRQKLVDRFSFIHL
jgi:hypothetical protein